MNNENNLTKTEVIDFNDLQTEFYTLRIGEDIPSLKIRQIRKVINSSKDDNLSGVDYKYLIESTDNKVLKVNSWILWKSIAQVLKEAGTLHSTLYLNHVGRENYTIKVV